jgi:hypothetical protein
MDTRETDQRLDIFGIEYQGALEEPARLRQVFRGWALVRPSHPLKIEIHRNWM